MKQKLVVVLLWVGVALAYISTLFLCLVAACVAIFGSLSRKLFDHLINILLDRDEDTGEWMYTHPIDILIPTVKLLKPRFSKASIMEKFRKSDPVDIHSDDDTIPFEDDLDPDHSDAEFEQVDSEGLEEVEVETKDKGAA